MNLLTTLFSNGRFPTKLWHDYPPTPLQNIAEGSAPKIDVFILSTEDGFAPLEAERDFFSKDLGFSIEDFARADWNQQDNPRVTLVAFRSRRRDSRLRGLILAPGQNSLSYKRLNPPPRVGPHRDFYYNVTFESVAWVAGKWGARGIGISHLSGRGQFHEHIAICNVEALGHFCDQANTSVIDNFAFVGCCIEPNHVAGIEARLSPGSRQTRHSPIQIEERKVEDDIMLIHLTTETEGFTYLDNPKTMPHPKPNSALLSKIISAYQTEAVRATFDFAIEQGIPHEGWWPKGRLAEAGQIPIKYSLTEMSTKAFPPRTEKNILESDGTVIISIDAKLSRGSLLTLNKSQEHKKPVLQISKATPKNRGKFLAAFIEQNGIRVLNVAGPGDSSDPRIYEFVKTVLRGVPKTALLTKIISSGQTGAVRAALDFAIERGIPHGGWCPKKRVPGDRQIPIKYSLTEMPANAYRARTKKNILESDGTVIISNETEPSRRSLFTSNKAELSPGPLFTLNKAQEHKKPVLQIFKETPNPGKSMAAFIEQNRIRVLNVASSHPVAYELVKACFEGNSRYNIRLISSLTL